MLVVMQEAEEDNMDIIETLLTHILTRIAESPLSDDEKQILMRDIKIAYDYFVNIVAQNRNLNVGSVQKLADGSTVMGEQALKDGLIDKIGSLPDVESFLTEKIGSEAKICWQN